jgi:hypothetical protein
MHTVNKQLKDALTAVIETFFDKPRRGLDHGCVNDAQLVFRAT